MSKHKLLLADDSVTIQKVVNLTFADEGIEVITVGDGNSAMEKFVEATPDLVMVDVNMPGVDGYRICEIIKQDEETKHVPVILLVGSFEPFDEEEARRVGANDYLTKPFQSIRQLVNKVTVLLNKSNGNEPAVKAKVEAPPITPQVEKQAEETSEPLGDPGMDDEMIQANQIGSLPVDDIQKFESGTSDFEIDLSQNQLKTPYSEPAIQQNIEKEENFGKTQPLSAEEFKELTTAPVAETSEPKQPSPPVSEERISAEERAISLEKQMVSEFESEAKQMSSDFEVQAKEIGETSIEMPSPQPVSQEETFTPEEIPNEQQMQIEEIQPEKGFEIKSIEPTAEEPSLQIQPVAEAETVLEEVYSAQEDSKIEETVKQEYYSEPKPAEVQEFTEPDIVSQPIGFTPSQLSDEQVSPVEPENLTETSLETEQPVEPKQETADWQTVEEKSSVQPEVAETTIEEPETVNEQPAQFQSESVSDKPENVVQTEQPSEPETVSETERSSLDTTQFADTIQFYPVEQFFDRDQQSTSIENEAEMQEISGLGQTDVETIIEPESKQTETEEETEPSYTESETSEAEFEKVAEPEKSFESEPEVAEGKATNEAELSFEEPEQSFVEEFPTPTIEIPAPLPTIEEEMPSVEKEEEPLKVKSEEETKEAKVDSLVSKKDTSEAVESVIVSEFARHSISLSSEAVETIATRIADKISEKIIERMADDVVGSLADRIVEKMERKKQE